MRFTNLSFGAFITAAGFVSAVPTQKRGQNDGHMFGLELVTKDHGSVYINPFYTGSIQGYNLNVEKVVARVIDLGSASEHCTLHFEDSTEEFIITSVDDSYTPTSSSVFIGIECALT